MKECDLRHGYTFKFLKKGCLFAFCTLLIGIGMSLPGLWNSLFPTLHQNLDSIAEQRKQLTCLNGSFSLKGMESCHTWLNCLEIENQLRITDKYLGIGTEKLVKEGLWQGHPVAVNILRHADFLHDFQHNLNMLQLFNKEPGAHVNKIVQLVGWCFKHTPVIVTEMYPLGAVNNVHSVLRNRFPAIDTLAFRFGLCIDFVHILHILHSHSDGPRVLCDANDPEKALSQFLLSENLSLVLNDMDALPVVNRSSGKLIKCGHRELHGDFVAPEQLWPYDTMVYDDNIMPNYDEKVDIWKIPDICNFLVGNIAGASKLQLHLFDIHSQCKQEDPKNRPSAKTVLNYYETVCVKLGLQITVLKQKEG